jgi:outer membrane protein
MKIKILTLILFLPVLIFAQNYTLDELLDLAMNNNTTLKQSQLNLEISKARLHSARINFLPDVSVGVSRTESFDNIKFERARPDSIYSYGQDAAYFRVSKSIALNNSDYFTNKNAKHDYNSAVISHEIQVQNTLYTIITNYLNVLENQKRLQLLEENIRIQESIVSESNQLFRQNKITQFEVKQSEVNLLNARIAHLNAQNNLNLSRKRLFDLINIPDDSRNLDEVSLYANEDSEEFSREINTDNILRVRQQEETVNKARTNITRTKLNFLPSVNLDYFYRRGLSSDDFSYNKGRTEHNVGLSLSYSLNNLLGNHYSYKEVKYLDEQNKLNTGQLIKDITLEYNQYIQELNYLQQRDELLDIILQQTTENLSMAQQRYRLGLVTQLDLEKASKENHDARIDKEINRYELIRKKLSIDYLLSNRLYK